MSHHRNRRAIFLTNFERQSGLDRQRHAELLILQLPEDHDGRNTWLLNYGVGPEAQTLRANRGLVMRPHKMAVTN